MVSSDEQLLRGLRSCMGRAEVMEYTKVAELAGLDRRSVRELDDGTTVGTLRKIAAALSTPDRPCTISDLVAEVRVASRPDPALGQHKEDFPHAS